MVDQIRGESGRRPRRRARFAWLPSLGASQRLSSESLDSLKGKTVLIVDDDPRNIFAVTSLLEAHGMKTLHAENGRAGIVMLERHPEIDIALIDIMMPEMDGYETMRLIRANPAKRWLPMIAVTAKALKEDRERCMAAGASDYLAKPIDDGAAGRADPNLGRRHAVAGNGIETRTHHAQTMLVADHENENARSIAIERIPRALP